MFKFGSKRGCTPATNLGGSRMAEILNDILCLNPGDALDLDERLELPQLHHYLFLAWCNPHVPDSCFFQQGNGTIYHKANPICEVIFHYFT